MKSGIRNLVLASCFLFAVTYDCYTRGVDYDVQYRLYAESDIYSCTLSTVYGRRWERLGSIAFLLGATLLIAAGALHQSEKQGANRNLSILIREE
jgi:hypothetical protein